MNQPDSRLSRDILALRYVESMQAGDLETVAALWDKASHDFELERLLVEVEGELFLEESAARSGLRAVRDSEVLSPDRPTLARSPMPRRWKAGMGLVGALAAACLVSYFAWLVTRSRIASSNAPGPGSVRQDAPQAPNGPDFTNALAEAQRFPGSARLTAFTWPLEMKTPITVGTPISPDLFN